MALGPQKTPINYMNIGFVLLTLFGVCYGKSKFTPMSKLLEGSVSLRCSTVACRSTIEGATRCVDTPSCLGIVDAPSVESPCMSCSCPADATDFNAGGIQPIVYQLNVAVFRKSGYYEYIHKHYCKWNNNNHNNDNIIIIVISDTCFKKRFKVCECKFKIFKIYSGVCITMSHYLNILRVDSMPFHDLCATLCMAYTL